LEEPCYRAGPRWQAATRLRRSGGLPPVALGEQAQAQGIELDEAFRVLLVVGAGVVLKVTWRSE
jgi:hypothetical protein